MEHQVFKQARWLVALIFALCIAWGCTSDTILLHRVPMLTSAETKGWSQVIDGVQTPLATVQDFAAVQAGESLVLEKTLDIITDEEVLMFYTKHNEVRVYIDDVLVYEFAMQDGFAFLQTPGNEWHQVFLAEEMSGAQLRIELTSQFAYYSNLLYDFYIIHYSQMQSVQLQWLWLRCFTAVFLLIVAIWSYVSASVSRGTDTRRYAILLADFYMVMAIWVFANSGLFDLVFRRPVVSYFIEMLSVRLVPVMAYLFIQNILSRRYLLVAVMGYGTLAHFFVAIILQFAFGVSFLSTLWVLHALLVCGALVDFWMIAHHLYTTRHAKQTRNYLFVCSGILFASALAEVWRFYALPQQDLLISGYIAVGYVLYTCVAYVALVRRTAGLDRGRIALEDSYNKLRNTTLMREINAHFFFNVLSGISSLCKQNPQKADEAVTLLAKYMRHYMYLINTPKNIPFVSELELIRVYLALEEMRFEGEFAAEMEIDFAAFEVPPLSVQPVVENAVMHGLRQCNRFGKLQLSSRRVGGYAVVTVQDNGAGFDVTALKQNESLALDNVRTRLDTMAKASIQIESEIGEGTTITIKIPLKKLRGYDDKGGKV